MQLELATINSMCHFLAEKLQISVTDIYDKWSTSQVLVFFAYYANKQAKENYQMWAETPPEQRKRDMPLRQLVYFKDKDEYREEVKEWQLKHYK